MDAQNSYFFVMNSPLDALDPFGLKKESTESDCDDRCLKFCQIQPDPADCAVKCFAHCTDDPNYVPGLICTPRVKPHIPDPHDINDWREIWEAIKELWEMFHHHHHE